MSRTPKHKQISDRLKASIQEQDLSPGDYVTTASQLAEEEGVSRQTAHEALRNLQLEGTLDANQGTAGYHVATPVVVRRQGSRALASAPWRSGLAPGLRDAKGDERVVEVQVTRLTVDVAPKAIAEMLDLEEGAEVFIRERILTSDGDPTQIATSYVNQQYAVPAIRRADTGAGGMYARMEEEGHILSRFVETVRAVAATHDDRTLLGMVKGVPIAERTRIAYNTLDKPMEVLVSKSRGDRVEWTYDIQVDTLGST